MRPVSSAGILLAGLWAAWGAKPPPPPRLALSPAPRQFEAFLRLAQPRCPTPELEYTPEAQDRGLFDFEDEPWFERGAKAEAERSPEFLSFEEWRRKSEEEARKDEERRKGAEEVKLDGAGIEGLLDSLRDNGMGSDRPAEGAATHDVMEEGKPAPPSADTKQEPTDVAVPLDGALVHPHPHAGTKSPLDPLPSLKSRTNYASFDCAATIHRSSSQSRSPSSILSEKKDRYMLTPCGARDKHVVFELCDEIEIDTLVIANFEFFSSMFKLVRMSVSSGLEGDDVEWFDAGTFRARNVRGLQVFPVRNLSGFYRYVRLDFMTHYGAEYYCPVSLVRVYGLTQIDAYRREQERERKRELEALKLASAAQKAGLTTEVEIRTVESVESTVEQKTTTTVREAASTTAPLSTADQRDTPSESRPVGSAGSSSLATASAPSVSVSTTSGKSAAGGAAPSSSQSVAGSSSPSVRASTTVSSDAPSASQDRSSSEPVSYSDSLKADSTSTIVSSKSRVASSSSQSLASSAAASAGSSTTVLRIVTPVVSSADEAPRQTTQSQTIVVPVKSPPVQQTHQGESIYGTIMKRLNALEANQSMSTRYIEEQGRLLRGAFSRVDRRLDEFEERTSRHETLLRQLLRDFEDRQAASDRDRIALVNQMELLADAVIMGKRLVLGQIFALLVVIVFVGLTRGAPSIPSGLQLVHTPKVSMKPAFAAKDPKGEPRQRKGSSYVFEARAGSASPVMPSTPRMDRYLNISRNSSVKRANSKVARTRDPREGKSIGPPKASKYKPRSQTPPPRLRDLASPVPGSSGTIRLRTDPRRANRTGGSPSPSGLMAPDGRPWLVPLPPTVASPANLEDVEPRLSVPSISPRGSDMLRSNSGTSQWADWATEGSVSASSVATESEDDSAPDTSGSVEGRPRPNGHVQPFVDSDDGLGISSSRYDLGLDGPQHADRHLRATTPRASDVPLGTLAARPLGSDRSPSPSGSPFHDAQTSPVPQQVA